MKLLIFTIMGILFLIGIGWLWKPSSDEVMGLCYGYLYGGLIVYFINKFENNDD